MSIKKSLSQVSRHPPLNALRCFMVAAELLSFKRAAEELHVTQAAISQQIRLLEDYLGRQLFHRQNRSVSLTPAGMNLLPFVQQGFSAISQGIDALVEDAHPNRLVLNTLTSFATRWLVHRLGDFRAENSEIDILLQTSTEAPVFEAGLDLAIRYSDGQYPGMEVRFLLEDPLLAVCHPSLCEGEGVVLNMTQIPVLQDISRDLSPCWDAFFQHINVVPEQANVGLQLTDSGMLVEAALAAQGVTVVRYSLVYELLEKGQLVCPFNFIYPHFAYYLVAPPEHFQWSKVIQFEQWIRHQIEPLQRSLQAFMQQANHH